MPEGSSPKYEMHSEAGLFITAALQTWHRKMATARERDSDGMKSLHGEENKIFTYILC